MLLKMNEKADRIVKDFIFFMILGAIMLFCFKMAYAAPSFTLTKVDDYHATITVTDTNTDNGETTTIIKEKTFTVKDINDMHSKAITAKQSWIDSQTSSELQVEANIALQQAQIDLATNIAEECQNQGICAPSDWVTGTDYAESNCVTGPDGVIYKCLMGHVSGVFTDDLMAGKWEVSA